MFSTLRALWVLLTHLGRRRVTVPYPEKKAYIPPRWRGRIILSRDPEGKERCVACYLCAAACPVDCIALQATEDEHGRRYPEWFRVNFSRCIFCGFCEEACPTYAIQLTTDYEMCEYDRTQLVYEKEDLLISGQGKYVGYDFYKHAGVAASFDGLRMRGDELRMKGNGLGMQEDKPRMKREPVDQLPPVDVKDLMP